MNHHYPRGSYTFTWPGMRSKARRDFAAAIALGALITVLLLSKWAGATETSKRCIWRASTSDLFSEEG